MDRDSTNVKDASVFVRLMNAINDYVYACKDNAEKVNAFIFNMDNEMHHVKDQLSQRLYESEIKLRNCDEALTLCEMRTDYDNEGNPVAPNCSYERDERSKAKRQQEVAQKNMNDLEELMRYAEQLKRKFRDSEKRFNELLEKKLPDAHCSLKYESEIIQKYLSLHPKQM